MKESMQSLCDNFIQNRDQIKEVFHWEDAYMYPVCAMVYTDQRQTVNESALKRSREILKDRTSVFSSFRSTARLVMTCMMAVSPDPEDKLNRAMQVYDLLKEYFWSSEYLPVAAMMIEEQVSQEQYGTVAARAHAIYTRMKKEHPFLTSGENSVLAAILAFSDQTDEQIIMEMEKSYELLCREFSAGNAVQSLSHVLTLAEGSADGKCEKKIAFYQAHKDAGCKYGTSYELATLGILALLPVEQQTLVQEIKEVDEYLASQKSYGLFGIGRKQRLMHAGMIVTSEYMESGSKTVMHSAAISGTISLIVAQQAAMCAAIAASSAAAASSASS